MLYCWIRPTHPSVAGYLFTRYMLDLSVTYHNTLLRGPTMGYGGTPTKRAAPSYASWISRHAKLERFNSLIDRYIHTSGVYVVAGYDCQDLSGDFAR